GVQTCALPIFTRRLRGTTVGSLGPTMFSDLYEEIPDSAVAEAAIELLEEALHDDQPDTAYLDGIPNILHQPEFRDVEKAKVLLGFLDDRETLADVLARYARTSGIKVTIGTEHPWEEMQACSMVTAT